MESSSRGREEFRESGIFRRSVPIKISPEHRLLVSITTGDEDICVLMAGLIEMWLTGKEREREIALRWNRFLFFSFLFFLVKGDLTCEGRNLTRQLFCYFTENSQSQWTKHTYRINGPWIFMYLWEIEMCRNVLKHRKYPDKNEFLFEIPFLPFYSRKCESADICQDTRAREFHWLKKKKKKKEERKSQLIRNGTKTFKMHTIRDIRNQLLTMIFGLQLGISLFTKNASSRKRSWSIRNCRTLKKKKKENEKEKEIARCRCESRI